MQIYIHPAHREALTLSSDASTLTRWSLATNPATKLIEYSGLVGAQFLPDGLMLISGGITGTPDGIIFAHARRSEASSNTNVLELRHWNDLSVAQTFQFPREEHFTSLASSPDNRWLVVGSGTSERLFLLDRLSGEIVSDHIAGGYLITGLTFDPTSTFVSGIGTDQGSGHLMLWRLDPVERFLPLSKEERENWRPPHDDGPLDHINGAAALTAIHWELEQPKIHPNSEWVCLSAFSLDSRIVIFSIPISTNDVDSGKNCFLTAYEVTTGKRLWGTYKEGYGLEPFVLTPDGKMLICSNGGRQPFVEANRHKTSDLLVYHIDDGAFVQRRPSGLSEPIEALALDHDNTTLWLATQNALVPYQLPPVFQAMRNELDKP